jgi:hypothetical protein
VSQQKVDDYQIELKVNGISVTSVRFCISVDAPNGFDVMIDDPAIGAFSLHCGFDLEVREEGSLWRPVSLVELKKCLAVKKKCRATISLSNSLESVERKRFFRLEGVDLPQPGWSRD